MTDGELMDQKSSFLTPQVGQLQEGLFCVSEVPEENEPQLPTPVTGSIACPLLASPFS